MDEGIDDPRLQAEGEVSMARLALDDAELSHAAEHAARALYLEPTLPEAHELLAVLSDPELFPLDQPVFLGTVLGRAHTLAARGKAHEALRLLVSAQRHELDGHWAAVPWVMDPALPARLNPGDITSLLASLVGALSGDPIAKELQESLDPYLILARNAVAAHPADPQLLWCAALFVRRFGHDEEAASLAVRSAQLEPSVHAEMALGYARRNQGRHADAEAAWLRGLALDPQNVSLMTDLAEMLAEQGRGADALAWTDRAQQIDPAHDCSYVTGHAIRFDLDQDVDHLVALADHLRGQETGTHAAGHADRLLTEKSGRRYWLCHLPSPSEAVVNVLHQVLEQAGPEASVGSLSLSAPEPPSALLAVSQALPGIEVSVTEVPQPDLRAPIPAVFTAGPIRSVTGQVWVYEGTTARPAVAPPSPEGVAALLPLAGRRWPHLPAAYDEAVVLAALPLNDLLGLLVHPVGAPPSPGEWPEWIRSVQAWAALGIAHHQADQPWPESLRRTVLIDLAFGPEDWLTEAGLLGLTATAWVFPETRREIAELVSWRFLAGMEAAQTRAVTILDSMALMVLATPGTQADIRDLARTVLAPPEAE